MKKTQKDVSEKISKEVRKSLEKFNALGEVLLIGVSGGPDSMCLLSAVNKLNPGKTIAVHINHMLRGKDSNEDEKFVKDFCKKNEIRFESAKIDVKKFSKTEKMNLEEAGRKKRYEFFEKTAKKMKAEYVLLAHNIDDNAETILMNFIRGTSLKGLTGISEQKEKILRPLLKITKKETELYCNENKIKFRVDKSNSDIKFRRNFLRHKLIPQIKKLNPLFTSKLTEKADHFKEAHEFLKSETENWMQSNCIFSDKKIACPSKKLSILPDVLKKTLIESVYEKFNKSTQNLETVHINEILSIINKNLGNKTKKIGTRLTVLKQNGQVIFYK